MSAADYRELEAFRLTRSLVVEAYQAPPGGAEPDRVLERAAVSAALHLVDGCRAADRAEQRRHLRASLEAVVALRRRLAELTTAGHLPPQAAAEMLAHQRRTEALLRRCLELTASA